MNSEIPWEMTKYGKEHNKLRKLDYLKLETVLESIE